MKRVIIDEKYPGNSKYKKEEKTEKRERLKAVAKPDEPSVKNKFINEFIGDKDEIKDYFVHDLVIPGIKDGILGILSMMFYHDESGGASRGGGHDYTRDYRSRNTRNNRNRNRNNGSDSNKVNYQDIRFSKRSDADTVCGTLRSRIREYGSASVGDLLDLIDVTPRHTDWDFGWTSEEDIGIRRLTDGKWLLDVTQAKEL